MLPLGRVRRVRIAKLVEPGYAPTTCFAQDTDLRIEDLIPPAYAGFAMPVCRGSEPVTRSNLQKHRRPYISRRMIKTALIAATYYATFP